VSGHNLREAKAMAHTPEEWRAYQANWLRRKRAAIRKAKAMNMKTMHVTELAALKDSGVKSRDLDLLNAIEREVWRRINKHERLSSRTPVKWTRKGDGSVSGESEPL
jgi:Txe/YoeB family toxin of Txe-Axe toxin-antitoxin module